MIRTFSDGQLYYANWKRLGDHHHHALGDIEITCPECDGLGMVEIERFDTPWQLEIRTCERCNGRGTYLREAEDNE